MGQIAAGRFLPSAGYELAWLGEGLREGYGSGATAGCGSGAQRRRSAGPGFGKSPGEWVLTRRTADNTVVTRWRVPFFPPARPPPALHFNTSAQPLLELHLPTRADAG